MTARPFLCIAWAGVLCNTYREAIPSVHTSGVRMCTLWASECAHLGLTHMHHLDVRTCTTRASECAHFGRCNSSGDQRCTLRMPERARARRATSPRSDCAPLLSMVATTSKAPLFPYIAVIVPCPRGGSPKHWFCRYFNRDRNRAPHVLPMF